MQLDKLAFKHKFYMIFTIILILVIGNILLLILPQTKGFLSEDLEAGSIMAFDRINYRLQSGYLLSFPSKGFLVPIEMNNNPLGFALFAQGQIAYGDQVYQANETYLFLQEDEYYEIVGNLYLHRTDEEFFIDTANNALKYALKTTAFLELPIGRKYYPMSEEKGNIVIYENGEFSNIVSEASTVLNYGMFYLTAFIHILFAIAIGFIVILLTESRAAPEPNRSLDVHFISYRPLQVIIISTIAWLALLSLDIDLITVQILLMSSLAYVIYHLLYIDKKNPYDLRLVNFNMGDSLIIPAIIGFMTYLIFGNTSITLSQFSFDLGLESSIFMITSFFWMSFVVFGFIPFILREFNALEHENAFIIAFAVLVYFAYILISGKALNLFSILNGLVLIPIYTLILNIYAKRVYNFTSVFTTIVVASLLIFLVR